MLLVLENEAGARIRERMPLDVGDSSEATRIAARQLAYRGIEPVRSLRLRLSVGNELRDDPELRRLFLDTLTGRVGSEG